MGQFLGWGRPPFETRVIASAEGFLKLTSIAERAGRVDGTGLRHPTDAEVEQLFARLVPPPPADTPSWDAVAATLERELASSAGNPAAGLADLTRLVWDDVWRVLDRLDKPASTGSGTYLSRLEQMVPELPDTDRRVVAAVVAASVKRSSLITPGALPMLGRLIGALIDLDADHQYEILDYLGVAPDDAEGLLAMLDAVLDDPSEETAGGQLDTAAALRRFGVTPQPPLPEWLRKLLEAANAIDRDGDDFKKSTWKGQPYLAYIGSVTHEAIAAYYDFHHEHAPFKFYNTDSVNTIIDKFIDQLKLKRGELRRVAKRLARTRPDILEFGLSIHGMPPGWLYEIKPAGRYGGGLARAMLEAEFYASVLSLCNIPVTKGPASPTAGTAGTIPVPDGWVVFVAPQPGAIVYKYVQASKRAREAKEPDPARVPAHERVAERIREALRQGPPDWVVWVGFALLMALIIITSPILAF